MFLYGILALAALVIAFITYFAYREMTPRSSDGISNIDVHFEMNRKQATDIRNILETHIRLHQSAEEPFYTGLSFAGFLASLERDYAPYLSRESYDYGKKKLRRAEIEAICNDMEARFHELLHIRRAVEARLK